MERFVADAVAATVMTRRFSLPILAAMALASGGLLGAVAGHATVSGMRSDAVVTERLAGAYGVPVRADPFAAEPTPIPAAWTPDASMPDTGAWDRGFRWGSERALRHVSACAIDSWSFQRGCEAAVREAAIYGEAV